MSSLEELRRVATAQQYSSGDVHGVSVKPSVLLGLLDAADACSRALALLDGSEAAAIREGLARVRAPLTLDATRAERCAALDALERLRVTGGPLMRWHDAIVALRVQS